MKDRLVSSNSSLVYLSAFLLYASTYKSYYQIMASETANTANSDVEAFKFYSPNIPWDEAPLSPTAQTTLYGSSKLVLNPNSVVHFPAGSDTVRVWRKPPGYDAFCHLFQSDVQAGCRALNTGEYSNDCMIYYINHHPEFLEKEPRDEEDPLRRKDRCDPLFAFDSNNGVWVLEGGNENHRRLLLGWGKGIDWAGQLQRAGATWYDDCECLILPPFLNGKYKRN